jgi:hypothetical protein
VLETRRIPNESFITIKNSDPWWPLQIWRLHCLSVGRFRQHAYPAIWVVNDEIYVAWCPRSVYSYKKEWTVHFHFICLYNLQTIVKKYFLIWRNPEMCLFYMAMFLKFSLNPANNLQNYYRKLCRTCARTPWFRRAVHSFLWQTSRISIVVFTWNFF